MQTNKKKYMADIYKENDKMSDLICNDYLLLQVLSRFGIPLGVGEKTVRQVCDEQQVHCNTFLAVANFTRYGEKVAFEWVDRLSVKALTHYLHQAHAYYLDFLLPGIRRKLIEAIDYSSHNEVSFLIIRFFDEYVAEVRHHMEQENDIVFPYIDELLEGKINEQISIEMSLLHQEPIEQKLRELKNMIVKYCYAPCNNNLLNIVLYDVYMCEDDLYTHARMEELLFLPAVHLLEEEQRNCEPSAPEEDEESGVLSEREKEIVSGVVKGLTNKEIADHLFISVNTVTTHRRNIARKLNIHSPAGLTIYAIVNKLVDMDDIKNTTL